MSNGFQQLHTTTTVRTVSQNDTGCNNFLKNISGCGGWSRTSYLMVMSHAGYSFPTPRYKALVLTIHQSGIHPQLVSAFPTRLGTALDGLAETNGLASSRLTLPTIPMRVSYWYSLRLADRRIAVTLHQHPLSQYNWRLFRVLPDYRQAEADYSAISMCIGRKAIFPLVGSPEKPSCAGTARVRSCCAE